MNSTSRWICSCVREVVPSKSMCSRKCEAPFVAGVSSRTPDSTATVDATIGFERDSRKRTRSPLARTATSAPCPAFADGAGLPGLVAELPGLGAGADENLPEDGVGAAALPALPAPGTEGALARRAHPAARIAALWTSRIGERHGGGKAASIASAPTLYSRGAASHPDCHPRPDRRRRHRGLLPPSRASDDAPRRRPSRATDREAVPELPRPRRAEPAQADASQRQRLFPLPHPEGGHLGAAVRRAC